MYNESDKAKRERRKKKSDKEKRVEKEVELYKIEEEKKRVKKEGKLGKNSGGEGWRWSGVSTNFIFERGEGRENEEIDTRRDSVG